MSAAKLSGSLYFFASVVAPVAPPSPLYASAPIFAKVLESMETPPTAIASDAMQRR
ncbi:MAG: hypothetical protein QOK33_1736 [Mycobacterium sp.]|nr:hypothetical protein [Mycobacterium sp.]